MPSLRGPAASARTPVRWAAVCWTVAWLLGCAGGPEPAATDKGKPTKSAAKRKAKTRLPESEGNCISPTAVTNFTVIDRTRIRVNTYPERVIELYDSCEGVRFMEELTFAGTGGIICDYRSDALIVQGVRCPIASIRDFQADADATLGKEIEGAKPGKDKGSKKEPAEKSP